MKLISPNFIGVYDNALSSYKCMEIIKFIESQMLVKGLFGRNKIDLVKKDDWEVEAHKMEDILFEQYSHYLIQSNLSL